MTDSKFGEALRPLAARLPRVVREYEILRVIGTLPGPNVEKSAELARNEVLKWAQRRSGGRLPPEAWRCEQFEYFSGGRNSSCVRIKNDKADVWAIRADDPDKTVAERVWTTEVLVGLTQGDQPQFSARLLVSTPEIGLDIEPHTPGLIQQVSGQCGLTRGGYGIRSAAWLIESDDETERLVDMLVDQNRALPVVVVTIPDRSVNDGTFLDFTILSRAVLGIGHVAVVPQVNTWLLTEAFGKQRSVFGGAVRVYMPGFSEDANPYAHKLFVAEQIATPDGANRCSKWIRSSLASASVQKTRLGIDVLTYSSIRTASLQFGQEQLEKSGASDSDLRKVLTERVKALEDQVARIPLAAFPEEELPRPIVGAVVKARA